MKRCIAAAVVVFFLAACSAQAEPVMLAYKFTKGELDKYRFSMNMSMTMPASVGSQAMNMTMSMVLRQRTLEVYPDGSAQVRACYSYENMSVSGAPGAKQPKMPKQQPVTVVMTMSPDGRVKNVEGMDKALAGSGLAGLDMSQFTNMMGMTALFPENAVDVGYTWKQTIPIPFGGGDMNVNSTVISIGEKIWSLDSVKIGQDCDATIDLTKLIQSFLGAFAGASGANQAISGMSGTLTLGGKMDYDFAPSIGKILKGNGDMKGTLKMSVPAAAASGGPSDLNMDMTMRMSMTRFK